MSDSAETTEQLRAEITALRERLDSAERSLTELRRDQVLFTALMDSFPDHIYFKDRQGRFLRVNKAKAARLGFADPAELVGKSDFDLFTEEFAAAAWADDRAVMESGQALVNKVEKAVWPSQRELWVTATKLPLRDASGQVVGLFGVSRDFTEFKLAEQSLRESEERHRSIFDSSPFPMFIYDRAELTLLAVNDALVQHYGYSRAELAEMTVLDLHAAEEQERLQTHLQNLPAAGHAGKWRHRDRTGRVLDVDIYAHNIPFGSRQARYVLAIDITERHRAETALRESETLYRMLFEKVPTGLGIADRNGNLIAYNDAMLKPGGYTRADIEKINNVALLYYAPEDRARALAIVREQGYLHHFEVRFKRKDGSPYSTLLDLIPVVFQGKPCHLALSMDITERKELEEQLRQAQKMEAIGRLAGGIAHDFNNLLTAILGNASLLLAGLTPSDGQYESLCAIDQAAQRAGDLTRQLLGFARQTALAIQPVDLRETLDNTVAILRHTIDPRIRLDLDVPDNPWHALADAGQMHQVLMNLCLNARDAMPDGGRLLIALHNLVLDSSIVRTHADARPGDFLRLRVQDTGHGIPAGIRQRIFDPFFTTKEPGKGTGLGLALVFGIVKQHQGWIECQSGDGQGTCFDLYLPARREAAATVTAGPTPSANGGSETVLIVDDEALIRNLGRIILERQGYRVLLAEDGAQALDIYKQEGADIHLIILDLMMPRLSGHDTLRALREINPAVRVIVSSGYSDADMPMGDGVQGVIHKPYRPNELVAKVRASLDDQRAPN